MAEVIIWKKSIWDNNFRCTKCGAKLFDAKRKEPTDNLGVDAEKQEESKQWLFCAKCKNLVGQAQESNDEMFSEEEYANVLNGDIQDWLERKSESLKESLRAEVEEQVSKRYERQIEGIKSQIERAEHSVKQIKKDYEKKILERDKRIQALTKELESTEARLRQMEQAWNRQCAK